MPDGMYTRGGPLPAKPKFFSSPDGRQRPGFCPPLQALLPWQSLGLFWLCGILGARWLWPALLTALLLLWADTRLRRAPLLVTAALLWGLGLSVAWHCLPQRPPTPAWLEEANANKTSLPLLEGVVHKVQGLPDQRLRILLTQLHVTLPSTPAAQAISQRTLPGMALWTWDQARTEPRPIPGQRVRLRATVRDTVGLRNPGLSDFGTYWAQRGVFWRLWSKGDKGSPSFQHEGNKPDHWRERGRSRLEKALLLISAAPKAQDESTAQAMPDAQGANSTQSTQSQDKPSARPLTLSQAQAFLPALLFGDRFHLNSTTLRHMSAASLVHSLALSGQHLALAGLVAALLTHGLAFCRPGIYLRLPRLKLMALLSLPLGAGYLWLGGAPPSLLRAFSMLVIACWLLQRNAVCTLMDILLAALFAITVVQPLAIFDPGLQLSALCVAAIALMLPLLRHLPRPAPPSSPVLSARLMGLAKAVFGGLGHIFLISLGIQMALLPLSLHYFETSGPWFALNVLWLPVLGFWVLPLGALGLALSCAGPWAVFWAHSFVLPLAIAPCEALLSLLQWLNSHAAFSFPALLRPHWTVFPAWGALLTALALLPGRLLLRQGPAAHVAPGVSAARRLALAAAVLLCLGPILRHAAVFTQPLSLTMLDVGQGQALHLALPGGKGILVDGGGSASPRFDPGKAVLIPYLTANQAPRLHAIYSTHPDMDHMRGLMAVLQALYCPSFYHNGQMPGDSRDLPSWLQGVRWPALQENRALSAGMVMELPGPKGLRLEVLHPPPGEHGFSGNNASLVVRLCWKDKGLALLTGDVEISALHALLASGQDLRAEVLVLPHHGSRRSLLPAFYAAVQPRLALVSSGRHNRFNFPARDVVQALQALHVPVFNTAQSGAVRLIWDGKWRLSVEEIAKAQ